MYHVRCDFDANKNKGRSLEDAERAYTQLLVTQAARAIKSGKAERKDAIVEEKSAEEAVLLDAFDDME